MVLTKCLKYLRINNTFQFLEWSSNQKRFLRKWCSKSQNKNNITFIYPKYESPFIVSINPNYSEWMDRYCIEWAVDNSGLMGQYERYRREISRSDSGLFGAVVYPSANWHRCEKLMKWSLIFFICDDYQDISSDTLREELKIEYFWDHIEEVLDRFLEDEYYTNNNWPQFVRAIQQILREIYFDFSDQQIKRSVKMIKNYINGNIKEKQWDPNKRILPDWNDYWSARLGSVGGHMALQLIEYAKHIELNDFQWNDNKIQDLNNLVNQQIILVNDYYTFRKEFKEINEKFDEMRHPFAILVHNQGMTLQSAVNKINVLIKEKDDQIIEQIKQIERCDQLKSRDVLEYISGVKQFLGGYWRHAVTARRYHGLTFNGVLPNEGQFIYNIDQTIIKPLNKTNVKYSWLKSIPQNIQPII